MNKLSFPKKIFLACIALLSLSLSLFAAERDSETDQWVYSGEGSGQVGFGYLVAIDEEWAVISSRSRSDGKISFFKFVNDSWQFTERKPLASIQSISLDGPFLACARAGGIVEIYKRSGNSWDLFQEINSLSATLFVDVSGSSLAIGEKNVNRVRIYELSQNLWQETAIITPTGAITNSRNVDFGEALDLNGDQLAVGSPNDDDAGLTTFSAGAVYVFEKQNGAWQQVQKIPHNMPNPRRDFGRSVAIEGDHLVVAAPHGGSNPTNLFTSYTVFFKYDGTTWVRGQQLQTVPTDNYINHTVKIDNQVALIGFTNDGVYMYGFDGNQWIYGNKFSISGSNFATSMDFKQNAFLVGADEYKTNVIFEGTALFSEIIARPKNITTTHGQYNNRTKLTWENRSKILEKFKIFRDGQEIGVASNKAGSYSDYNGTPGKIHKYEITAWNSFWGNSAPAAAPGWKRPNGRIDGKVLTRNGAGVKDVELQINPQTSSLNRAVAFTENSGYMDAGLVKNFPDTAITVSYWMKITGHDFGEKGTPFSYSTDEHPNNAFTIWNSFEQVAVNDEGVKTDIDTPDNVWTHVAVTWRSSDGRFKLFHNGQLDTVLFISAGEPISSEGSLVFGQDQDVVGGAFHPGQAFIGLMDEIQIWKTELSDSLIAENMYKQLVGNEENLVSYWSFDDDNRSYPELAADIAFRGSNHGELNGVAYSSDAIQTKRSVLTDANGKYDLRNIFYDESGSFELTPFKTGHGFDPGLTNTSINTNGPRSTGIGFTDTTSLTVAGKILLAGSDCAVPGVQLFLNGENTGVVTDGSGTFRLTIEDPGFYTIKPVYKNVITEHEFSPAEFSGNIFDNIFDMDFSDQTTSNISGKVGAGCNTVVGKGEIHITSAGNQTGCVDTTFWTDVNGNYQIDLPAQPYLVELLQLDPPNPIITESFDPVNTDLTFQDTTLNFIYRKPPIIRIVGLPEICTNAQDPFRVPVVDQYETLNLTIEILEEYGGDTCMVDTGFVTIYDDIGGDPANPVTVPIENGLAYYSLTVGEPNILDGGTNPFQKLLQIVADAEGKISTLNQWILVTGNRPREKTFVTRTPELPLLILRDPPGDQSSAFWEKGSSVSYSYSNATEINGSGGIYWDAKIGKSFKIPFVGKITTFIKTEGEILSGRDNKWGNEVATTFTFSEKISTSNSDDFTGDESDIIMGGSFNLIYALTDVIGWDESTCSVIQDTSLAWGGEEFATNYLYTVNHIQNTLLPQLRTLKSLSSPDSAALIATYIDVWEQVVEKNKTLKDEAIFEKNLSFSGGTSREYSATVERESSTTYEYTVFIDSEVKVGLGFGVDETEKIFGVAAKFRWSQQESSSKKTNSTASVGYVLADDDIGDFFSVDVKHDPVYKTPVFKLVSGTSSCPFEPGTQPRDEPLIGLNTFQQYNIAPHEPAAFILTLGNASQSGETRDYNLRVLQSSNYDGAVISVGGVVIEDFLDYTIPAGQQIVATMTVEKGPIAYSYQNLQLVLESSCDASVSDTATFTVNFRSLCPSVELYRPVNNWLVNQGNNDSLLVILRNYDKENPELNKVSLQYRKIGEAWKTAITWEKNVLPDDFIYINWNVENLPDGEYELRATSNCGSNGLNYSEVATGLIDRSTLYVFGNPSPADGILNIGEDIRVDFTANLSCSEIREENITLTDADNGEAILFDYACSEKSIILTPKSALGELEGRMLTATVSGIKDDKGNKLQEAVSWSFTINQNAVYWLNPQISLSSYQNEESGFTAVLTNVGGAAQNFTLDQIPAWLSADLTSGTLQANAQQDIVFSVGKGLNIGTYSDTIFAEVAGQGTERLFVTLEILSAPPDWRIVSSQYQYSMNIIAQIAMGDTFANDEKDIIAVFDGDQIRGRANLQFVSDTEGYLAFLTVYSNSPSGETFIFKTWDASSGRQSGFIQETVLFSSNSTLGVVQSPLTLHPSGQTQSIGLNKDWSWFSLNVAQDNMGVNNVLKNLAAREGDVIKSQQAMAIYSPELGWVGSLQKLETGQSYRLKITVKDTLDFPGAEISLSDTPILLSKGWNWLGYLPQEKQSVQDALSGFPAADGDQIKSQERFTVYNASSNSWQGDLTVMQAGDGYLLKSQNAATFLFGNEDGSAEKLGGFNNSNPAPLFKTTATDKIDIFSYEASMNIVAVLQLGGLNAGDTNYVVNAFQETELRGRSKLTYIAGLNKWMLFMTVYGQPASTETIRFEFFDGNVTLPITEELTFAPDAVWGNLSQPTTFTVQDNIAPEINATFQYSSEPGLSRFLKLFISTNEPLARPPIVLVNNTDGSEENRTSVLFDGENNIYMLDYEVAHNGENKFYIISTDFGNNTVQTVKSLNVQNIVLGKPVQFNVDTSLSISISPADIEQNMFLYTEHFAADTTLSENLRMLSPVYSFNSPQGFNGSIGFNFIMEKSGLNEEESKKSGLYKFDIDAQEWVFVSGKATAKSLQATGEGLGLYAVIYDVERVAIPDKFALRQNYPNPFNPATTIRFDLPEVSKTRLDIFNILGQRVATLINNKLEAGYHSVLWNGRDNFGNNVASGLYFYKIQSGKFIKSRKMILLR